MYIINPDSSIYIAKGDTIQFNVELQVNDEPAQLPAGTVGVFAVCKATTAGGVRTVAGLRTANGVMPVSTQTLLSKVFNVDNGHTVIVRLDNSETRELAAGTYNWDMRIVTDPEYDDQGNVKCDDTSDEVISLFSGAVDMPKFIVTEVAVDV